MVVRTVEMVRAMVMVRSPTSPGCCAGAGGRVWEGYWVTPAAVARPGGQSSRPGSTLHHNILHWPAGDIRTANKLSVLCSPTVQFRARLFVNNDTAAVEQRYDA